MARTVIGLSRAGDKVQATLERAPLEYVYDTVEVDLAQVQGTDLAERGARLVELLRTKEPVKAGLDALLSHPVGSPAAPLYFHVRSTTADAVTWEALFTPPIGFCALDQRYPVGRIAERVSPVRRRPFRPPLRVVAVLSAAGRDARPQLQALRDSVASVGVPVDLLVITGDEDLIDELSGTQVRTELIAGTPNELCVQLAGSRPHVLHLLCHGRKRAGVSSLAFASIADVDSGRSDLGSINVSVAELVAALQAADPWLVVLAACQTGAVSVTEHQPDPSDRPFAHDLVHSGLTAAIGMRRLVDLTDTNRFCTALYPQVMAAIQQVVDPPGKGEQILDWAAALTAPRQVMSGADPSIVDAWTDPVLYVQNEELRVYAESTLTAEEYARLQGRLDEYRGFLEHQDPARSNPELIARVEAEIARMQLSLTDQ